MAVAARGNPYLQRAPSPSGLADVIDVILDKGLVLDAYVRVSVIGIEVLTIDARVVIASVDTYLRFAEQVNRLDLTETQVAGLPELQKEGAEMVTEHKLEQAEDAITGGGSLVRKAVLGAAAGAAAAGAAAAASSVARRSRDDDGQEDGAAGQDDDA